MRLKLGITSWMLVKLIIFYCILSSARACMTLGDNPYHDLLLSVICFIYFKCHGCFVVKTKNFFASIALVIASVYTMHGDGSFAGHLAMLFMVFIPSMLICLKNEIKIELLETLSEWFAILSFLSAVAWGLHLLGISLPHNSQVIETTINVYGARVDNYYLFREVHNLSPYINTSNLSRFNGFCLEPGHMGTISVFFLFANRFDFARKHNLVFLFVILITMSAAAYSLTIVGYIFYKISCDGVNNKFKLFQSLFVVAIILFVIIQGDNTFNDVITSKFTRESGPLDGRVSDDGKLLFDNMWASSDFIFGYGVKAQVANSAGYKVFFIMHGLIGIVLVIFSYYLIYVTNKSKLAFYMFVLYLINYTQRTYCFWDAFLDPYILSLPSFAVSKFNLIDKYDYK